MATIFWDGFDKYGTTGNILLEWFQLVPAAGFFTQALVAGRFGGSAYQMGGDNGGTGISYLYRQLGSNYSRLIGGFAFETTLRIQCGVTLTDNSSDQISVDVNSLGKVEVRLGSLTSTVLATSSQSVLANTWHFLEFDITINNTTGAWTIKLDGVTVLWATNQNTRGGSSNNSANALKLATGPAVGINMTFDDIYLFDSTGSFNNAMRGDSRVETQFGTSDSAVQWSGVGSLTSATAVSNATNFTPGANVLFLRQATAPAGGTLNSVTVLPNATSAAAKSRAAVYADSAGAPSGAPLATGTEVVGATSGVALVLPLSATIAITQGTKYWIGYITDTSLNMLDSDSSNLGFTAAATYTSGVPNPAPAMTSGKGSLVCYGQVTACTQNYPEVNDNPNDGDLSYVFSSTAGQEDLYGFPALSSTPSNIAGIKVSALVKKTDAGARTVDLRVKSGATDSAGTNPGQAPGASYAYLASYFETDPNTAAAWTASGVNSAISGQKIAS